MSDDAQHTDEAGKPSTKADEPSAKASEPSAKASEPSAKASEPSAKANEPSAKAAKATEPRSAVLREPELPAAGTPEGETLRRGLALYELGNYREMRAILTPLTTAKDPAVADAANALLRRIAVDPVQIGFLVGCLLAILAIAGHYLGH